MPNVPRVDAKQPSYASYRFEETEWSLIEKIHSVLEVCNLLVSMYTMFSHFQESGKIQQQFSSDASPLVWKVLPMIEEFMQNWTETSLKPDYKILHPAIQSGLQTMGKYFGVATRSSAQILNLCKSMIISHLHIITLLFTDLNPLAKRDYFEIYWKDEGKEHANKVIDDVVRNYFTHLSAFSGVIIGYSSTDISQPLTRSTQGQCLH